MKTNHYENDNLNGVLRTWRITEPLPPHFRDAVWLRIERENAKSGFSLLAALSVWLRSVLPLPKVALCYVTTLLLAGMVSGLWIGHEESHRMNADLGLRYVRSVDPYKADPSNR